MAAADLQLPDLFGHEWCKRIKDEKCLFLKPKTQSTKISDRAQAIASCETNKASGGIIASLIASHIVKPQLPYPFDND